MFETDRLIYPQMQKTACTHIARILSKTVGGKQVQPKHTWLTNYDSDKLILGTIRNPWDWYVSLWAYGSKEKGGLHSRLTTKSNILGLKRIGLGKIGDGLHEIRKPISLWQSVYGDPMNPTLFRGWLQLVMNPERARDLGERYHESSISGFAGFMTYRYCKLYLRDFFEPEVFTGISSIEELREYDRENCLIDLLVHQENLEEELIEALQESGHSITEDMLSVIREGSKKKVNVSDRESSVSYYYDKETIDLVAKAEQFIIEKYSYAPPEIASQKP